MRNHRTEGPAVQAINDGIYTRQFRHLLQTAPRQKPVAELMIPTLLQACAEAWGLSADAFTGPGRIQIQAEARFCAMRLLERLTHFSLVSIGLMLGSINRTTMYNGLRRAKELMETDPLFRSNSETIEAALRERFPNGIKKTAGNHASFPKI